MCAYVSENKRQRRRVGVGMGSTGGFQGHCSRVLSVASGYVYFINILPQLSVRE